MAAITVAKTIGTTGTFSTVQLWEDGSGADLTTAEKSAATTFLVAAFVQGETLSFVGSGAAGVLLDTDSTGAGTGTYVTYGITSGNPATSDVVTGATSGATCILTSGTATNVGVVWRGQCQNQEFSTSGQLVLMTGTTQSSVAYKELTTVAGASFRDHVNAQTNALRYNSANGACLKTTSSISATVQSTNGFNRLSNLQIANTTANAEGIRFTGSTSSLSNLIVEATTTSTSTTAGVLGITGTCTVTNSVFIQRQTAADHIIATGVNVSAKFYNCTFVAADDLATAPTSVFLSGASAVAVTVQNCGLFAGDSTKAVKAGSAIYTFTTCYSDISGTTGVTQTTYANEFQNVNDATRDFRLKLGAAQLNTGTTDATNAPTDIVGTARPYGPAYDVGCWELIAPVIQFIKQVPQAISRSAFY